MIVNNGFWDATYRVMVNALLAQSLKFSKGTCEVSCIGVAKLYTKSESENV